MWKNHRLPISFNWRGFFRYGRYSTTVSPYVDGISITYGQNPRQHVWTFASGLLQYATTYHRTDVTCPGVGGDLPPGFVANNYFCSSGNSNQFWVRQLYSTSLWSSPAGNCHTLSSECYLYGDPLSYVLCEASWKKLRKTWSSASVYWPRVRRWRYSYWIIWILCEVY